MALGPRGSSGLSSASRPKHHAGSGPLSSNVRAHRSRMTQTHSSADFVRRNPEPFVGASGKPDLRNIAGALAVDALVLGEQSVTVERFEEWFIVAAKGDWLTRNTELSLVECFHRLQRFPELRENTHRSTVVVTAFAANVLALGPEGQTVIKGCNCELAAVTDYLAGRFPGWRVVAFSTLVPPEPSSSAGAPATPPA